MRLTSLTLTLASLFAGVACEPVVVYELDGDGDGVEAEFDCNDANARVYPGANEVCNGTDDNCNGEIDEEVTLEFWADTDRDGYGDPFASVQACYISQGIVQNNRDCNDSDREIRPFATEQWYDGVDQNCDGLDDFDQDGDGYVPTETLEAYDAYVTATQRSRLPTGDCDDTRARINPEGVEVCNNRDDDCNGASDDGLPQHFYDADQDGHGDARIHTCAVGPLWADVGDDCDDTDATRYPEVALTVCGDGIDDDCDGYDEPCEPISCFVDNDEDGYGDDNAIIEDSRICGGPRTAMVGGDCDDTMLWRNPGAAELCGDGIDNDCNLAVDDGCPTYVCWVDADGDHFGDPLLRLPSSACGGPGSSWNDRDCDDTNAHLSPKAVEICGDGVDNDCDGQVDDGCVADECWADADGDGFGDAGALLDPTLCGKPGSSWSNTDCDDTEPAVRPNRVEDCGTPIDDNCDGSLTIGCVLDCWADADADGFGDANAQVSVNQCEGVEGLATNAGDCDDKQQSVSPASAESCYDQIDNNCDGQVNEGCVLAECWLDADYDGFGDAGNPLSGRVCQATEGVAINTDDCDDSDDTVNPLATEVCGDHWDNNCDTRVDEDCPVLSCWLDADQDGFGDGAAPRVGFICESPYGALNTDDCDDTDPNTSPTAQELCADGVDNNCDNQIDEGCPPPTECWIDLDGDGQGDPNQWRAGKVCDDGIGVAFNADDCDDTDPNTSPTAQELCADGVDNNCDNQIDEGCPPPTQCWIDLDGDGQGDPNQWRAGKVCDDGIGVAFNADDCDDTDSNTRLGGFEVCADGVDNNCDNQIDEGCPPPTECWIDYDGDGQGDPNQWRSGKICDNGLGVAFNLDDCDDTDPNTFLGAQEVCYDHWDNNCNNQIDEGCAILECWADSDGDHYGDPNRYLTGRVCEDPKVTANNPDDCDDRWADTFPGALEQCDGRDNNCDNQIDEGCSTGQMCWADGDSDGFGDPGSPLYDLACNQPGISWDPDDCDDADPAVSPGAAEQCANGIDDNCDYQIDEWCSGECWDDLDNDGYGDPKSPFSTDPVVCSSPQKAFNADDCDDTIFDPGWPKLGHWRDRDGDGYGDPNAQFDTCPPPPTGFVANPDDCDDWNSSINPANGNCAPQMAWCSWHLPQSYVDVQPNPCERTPTPIGQPEISTLFVADIFSAQPSLTRVNMTPVVARLMRPDGFIDQYDPPFIVVTMNDGFNATVRAIDVFGGQEQYRFDGGDVKDDQGIVHRFWPLSTGELAVGQLDNTGEPMVAMTLTNGTSCVVASVNLRLNKINWHTPLSSNPQNQIPCGQHAPTIVDFDGDGLNEVSAAMLVWDGSTGAVKFDGASVDPLMDTAGIPPGPDPKPEGTHAVVADMDQDGILELISGPVIWHPTAQPGFEFVCRAQNADATDAADGYPAIIDPDLDGVAELAIVRQGQLQIFEGPGGGCVERHNFDFANNIPGIGSPPVVGDVDGDSLPDLVMLNDDPGVPGPVELYLWRAAAPTLLTMYPNINASGQQAPALYDVDGDGDREIFLGERTGLLALDWTGSGLTSITTLGSYIEASDLLAEGLAIADIDSDGQGEIVVPRGIDLGQAGVEVLRSAYATRAWAAAGSMWNQAQYTPGMLDSVGYPTYLYNPMWSFDNLYPRDASKPGMPYPTWDLSIDPYLIDSSQVPQTCQTNPGDDGRFQFHVRNLGSLTSPGGIPVELVGYQGTSRFVLQSMPLPPIPPQNTSETLLFNFPATDATTYDRIDVEVNPTNEGDECIPTDNVFTVDLTPITP